MRVIALAAAGLLALAACSQGVDDSRPPAEVAAPPVLAGIDLTQPLRAVGTEPFWGLEVTPQALSWSGVDQAVQTAANPGPEMQGTTATWRTETAGDTLLVLTLIATECSDGMSDRVYPLTARVEIGDDTLTGCAASKSAIMVQPAP